MLVYLPARLSVHTEHLGFYWTVLIKFDIRVFFENLSRKIQVSLKLHKKNEYFS